MSLTKLAGFAVATRTGAAFTSASPLTGSDADPPHAASSTVMETAENRAKTDMPRMAHPN
jgi:hypothetical protein